MSWDWSLRSLAAATCAAGAVMLGSAARPAEAQVQCSILTLPQLLLSFSDTVPPASITPHTMRNLACSVFPTTGVGTVTRITGGTGVVTNPTTITTTGSVALAPVSDATLLANTTGIVAAPLPNTLSAVLDHDASASRGTLLYRGATLWAPLPAGLPGQVLVTSGTTADPSWQYPEQTTVLSYSNINPIASMTQGLVVFSKFTAIVLDSVDSTEGSGSSTLQLVTNTGTMSCGGSTTITIGGTEAVCTATNTIGAGGSMNAVVVVTSGNPAPWSVALNYHVVP